MSDVNLYAKLLAFSIETGRKKVLQKVSPIFGTLPHILTISELLPP